MVRVRSVQPVAPVDAALGHRLAVAVAAAGASSPFGEPTWRDLDRPAPTSIGLVAERGDVPVGYGHVRREEHTDGAHWVYERAVPPDAGDGVAIAGALDAAALEAIRDAGGGTVWAWTHGSAADAVRADGFVPDRELLQMTVPLPLADPPAFPRGVRVRTFEPGADDEEWLVVNNAAFAGHPEQGGWTAATLRTRLAAPWFDAAGFLLAEHSAGLLGFCWTKLREADIGTVGEIYVIGVSPRAQGRGLGRALVVAGLRSLAERGATTGMLYVDAADTPAVSLYASLGFHTVARDHAYRAEVRP